MPVLLTIICVIVLVGQQLGALLHHIFKLLQLRSGWIHHADASELRNALGSGSVEVTFSVQ